ncbi:MAG TPA: FHA domain-containing protein [Gemmataceae bacterium]|jgi:anti-anti-sigma regulatory factor|nr:FHA domain-containing protein [Gemmataceae bacterium]
MKFYLIVAKGSKKGLPVPIHVDLFLIGSEKMCQLRAKNLGPKHCAIVTSREERKVSIRDMNSGAPTMVNDSLLPPGEEWPLHAGDRIAFGNLEFMIQYHEHALSRRDLEEWAAKCLDITNAQDLFDEGADEFHRADSACQAAQNIIGALTAQRGLVMGRLRIGRESGVTTVRFNDTKLVDEGEIAYIKKELCEHLDKPNLRVLLDCKNVKRMSTGAVMMIRDFCRWLKTYGSTMALCRVRLDVRLILAVMDANDIPLFPDKRTALLAQW